MSPKEKFPLYLSPEKKATLERRHTEDGSRSITGFIENAIVRWSTVCGTKTVVFIDSSFFVV